MTKEYPLITVQNINYWYWFCDPHWSQIDIANEVGCSRGTVSLFMINHNIPRRNFSEAQLNRFTCPHKQEDHQQAMNIPEVRNSISESVQKLWRGSDYRIRLTKAHQERGKNMIGFAQFKVLKAIYNNPNKTLADLAVFPTLSSFTEKQLDLILKRIFAKGFITRKKDFKDNKSRIKTYYYSTSEKGKEIYEENSNNDAVKRLRERRLGKVQMKILSLIKEKGSLFFTEIVAELKKDSINNNSVQHSICLLFENKFLFRTKKFNKDIERKNKLEFKYSLHSFGEGIQESYKGLGAIQYSILNLLTNVNGCFYRELKTKDNFKPFYEKAILKALRKLSNDKLINRIKKKDSTPAGDNRTKYFYRITKVGRDTLKQVS